MENPGDDARRNRSRFLNGQGGLNVSTAEEDRISLRQAEACGLRVKGHTYREIATKLEVSVGQAHADVHAAMAETLKLGAEDAEMERWIQLRRLDGALKTVNEVLDAEVFGESGERDHELRLKALDRLVKLEERRAKLLGLDAPAKQEIDAKVTGAASPAEAARLIREAFGEHAARNESARGLPEDAP